MMMLSTPSPANWRTRSDSLTRESALAMPCTWWSEEMKPVVSRTRAIFAGDVVRYAARHRQRLLEQRVFGAARDVDAVAARLEVEVDRARAVGVDGARDTEREACPPIEEQAGVRAERRIRRRIEADDADTRRHRVVVLVDDGDVDVTGRGEIEVLRRRRRQQTMVTVWTGGVAAPPSYMRALAPRGDAVHAGRQRARSSSRRVR